MAWTTPGTAVAGEVLTAAYLNTNVRDNSAAIRDAQVNVQQTVLTSVATQAVTGTATNITGLTVSITPSASTSKVLFIGDVALGNDPGFGFNVFLLARSGTAIYRGDAAGTRSQGAGGSDQATSPVASQIVCYLDSPATTSSITYTIQVVGTGGTLYINRGQSDDDSSFRGRFASSLTVMEIPV